MRRRIFKNNSVVLVLCLLAGACASVGHDDVGKPAPGISFETLDGGALKISDMKGSVVVIDFWATWCPPCQKSMPNLNRLAGDGSLAARGLKVVAVDCREDSRTVKEYLTKNNFTLTVAMDESGAAARDFQVQGLPTTVIIGRDGTIRNVLIPINDSISDADLDSAIEKALGPE